MNQITHKEKSSSLLRLESALGMDQNRPITVCNDSHNVFVHIHLGAKEPRKPFSLNSEGGCRQIEKPHPAAKVPDRLEMEEKYVRSSLAPQILKGGNCAWNLLFSYICKGGGALASSVPPTDPHRCWNLIFQLFLFFFHLYFKPSHVGDFPLESHSW